MLAQRRQKRVLVGRPYHVYDYEGEHLGSFADWDMAHEWAHLQVAMNGIPAPLDVEDRRHHTRRRIWADHCEQGAAHTVGQPTAAGPASLGTAALCAVAAPAFTPPRPRGPS
jgi:hypothetical protein